jgi:glycosyltransferase involved in cell wall biosynthesis
MRIAILCNPSTEASWSPASAETGIGGSEEAVIYVSAALARLGHQVTVCNRLDYASEEIEGVTYKGYRQADEDTPADVGIVWRYPRLRWFRPAVRSRKLYLWLHDAFSEERILHHVRGFHKVMVLSAFHRSLYRSIEPNKCFVTRNGIVPEHFKQRVARVPCKVVYGSSYNRGLRHLLLAWPQIRKAVAGAELRVFYGWQSLEHLNPGRARELRPYFEDLMRQEGITHLGKIGHVEVAREYLSAGVWAYPASFPEVSCISAMKAQAGGAIPVVIPSGALKETVRFGFKTEKAFTDYPGKDFPLVFLDQWQDALIDYLRNTWKQQAIRNEMMRWSLNWFSWQQVAQDWAAEFSA